MKRTVLTIAACTLMLSALVAQMPAKYSIIDPATGITWSAYADNPTSIYRYQMGANYDTKRLPSIEELTALYSKLSRVMQNNPSGLAAKNLDWFTETAYYPSSTETMNEQQKSFHKGISWDKQALKFEEVLISGGDLVMITEVSK